MSKDTSNNALLYGALAVAGASLGYVAYRHFTNADQDADSKYETGLMLEYKPILLTSESKFTKKGTLTMTVQADGATYVEFIEVANGKEKIITRDSVSPFSVSINFDSSAKNGEKKYKAKVYTAGGHYYTDSKYVKVAIPPESGVNTSSGIKVPSSPNLRRKVQHA